MDRLLGEDAAMNKLTSWFRNAADRVAVVSGLPALRSRQMAKGVVMFHVGRCGSSVLADMLSQHSDVQWHGEVYESKLSDRKAGLTPVLSGLYCRSRVVGWEIKFLSAQHLKDIGMNLPSLIDELTRAGIQHFIVLRRENTLRRMVSHVVSQKTRVYQQRRSALSVETVRMDVNNIVVKQETQSLLGWLNQIDEAYDQLGELLHGLNVLQLEFEGDVEPGPRLGFDKICRFLDIPLNLSASVRLKRMNPHPICEIVENWQDVESHLRGSPFEWMLNE